MPWQLLILRSFSGVKLKQFNHTTFCVVLAQVVSLPLSFDKGAELPAEADAGVSTLFRWAGISQLSGFCWQAAREFWHKALHHNVLRSRLHTVRHTRHVLQWHRRFWCNCTAPLAATQYITYTASTFAQISYSVLSTPTTLFYQSSLLVFLMCKSLPRSTVWSQYLITLIILIIEPGSYSQCTCIVFHKKFSNWGNLLFHTTATLPTPPWMPCFHVLSSKAFSEFLLSYWSIPPALFITRPGFSAFSLPTKLSFLTLSFMQRMPFFIKSNYLFFFLFYNLNVTKYRNNVSEWE